MRETLEELDKYDHSPIGPARTLVRAGTVRVVDRSTWGRTPDAIRGQQLAEREARADADGEDD